MNEMRKLMEQVRPLFETEMKKFNRVVKQVIHFYDMNVQQSAAKFLLTQSTVKDRALEVTFDQKKPEQFQWVAYKVSPKSKKQTKIGGGRAGLSKESMLALVDEWLFYDHVEDDNDDDSWFYDRQHLNVED